jgi:hypothetical protein
MTYSVVYVHGTRQPWQRLSEFVRQRLFPNEPTLPSNSTGNEKLDRVVAEALQCGVVEFECFEWSGANSFHERSAAARRLGNRLEVLADSPVDRRIYLIAHSHGGNVVLEALARLSDRPARDAVWGVICGATPFLIKGTSEQGRAITSGFSPALGVLVALLHLWLHWYVAGVPVLLVCGILLAFVSPLLLKWAQTRSLAKLAGIPNQCPIKDLLILRKPGDEASEALGSAHLLAWAVGRLWLAAEDRPGAVWDWEWLISHLVRAVILPASILVLGPLWLAFGMDGINPAMFVEVFAESTPVGEWRLHLVQGKQAESQAKHNLRHSVFDDDYVISELGRWLRLHAQAPPVNSFEHGMPARS